MFNSSDVDWARRALADAGFSFADVLPDPRITDSAFDAVRKRIDVMVRGNVRSLTSSFDLTLWRADSTDSAMEVIDAFARYGEQQGMPHLPSGISGRWYKQITNAIGLTFDEQQKVIRRLDPEPWPT